MIDLLKINFVNLLYPQNFGETVLDENSDLTLWFLLEANVEIGIIRHVAFESFSELILEITEEGHPFLRLFNIDICFSFKIG